MSAVSLLSLSKNTAFRNPPLSNEPIPAVQTSIWKHLGPVISIIGAGVILSPAFRQGAALGLLESSLSLTLAVALPFFIRHLKKDPSDSRYANEIRTKPFVHCIAAPFIEEMVFRGVLQTLVTAATHSPVTGGFISALLFGAMHLSNDHPYAKQQSVLAGVSGAFYSVLKHRYGILAPLGAHMINNTLGAVVLRIASHPIPGNQRPEVASIHALR